MRTVCPPRPASIARQGWRDRAACRGIDPEAFFADDGSEAQAICAVCPVSGPCLQFALASPEPWGTWGGVPEGERRGMEPAARNGPGLCGKGLHVLTPDNIYAAPGGQKTWCRACRRIADEKRRLKEKYERETIVDQQGAAA